MFNVTPGQYRVLKAIHALHEKNGYVPTYPEIGASLGISAPAVWKHIDALQKKGYIKKTYGIPYSLELTQGCPS